MLCAEFPVRTSDASNVVAGILLEYSSALRYARVICANARLAKVVGAVGAPTFLFLFFYCLSRV